MFRYFEKTLRFLLSFLGALVPVFTACQAGRWWFEMARARVNATRALS
jgi:hypothetical protein